MTLEVMALVNWRKDRCKRVMKLKLIDQGLKNRQIIYESPQIDIQLQKEMGFKRVFAKAET